MLELEKGIRVISINIQLPIKHIETRSEICISHKLCLQFDCFSILLCHGFGIFFFWSVVAYTMITSYWIPVSVCGNANWNLNAAIIFLGLLIGLWLCQSRTCFSILLVINNLWYNNRVGQSREIYSNSVPLSPPHWPYPKHIRPPSWPRMAVASLVQNTKLFTWRTWPGAGAVLKCDWAARSPNSGAPITQSTYIWYVATHGQSVITTELMIA